MSYSDPKLINDKRVEIVGGMTEMAKQQFAAERQADQQRVTQNISSLVQGGINALTPKAQAMNKLDRSIIKSSQNMYNKIGSSEFDTGLEKWDETLDGFMNGIVDKNNLTVQAMNNGSMIDLSKGQRDIAMYENIVDIYQEAVPNIRAASNVINRSANATEIGEKLSLTGPPAYQLDIIRKMNTDEAADLQIIQEGNNIIIRDPNATYIDPETGEEVKGTELNINQFNKAITDKENPYFKYAVDTKPDTERNFNQKIKSGKDGAFNPLYVTINDKAKDSTGQEVTTYNMTIAQQEKFKKDVMGDKGGLYANGGQFAGLIDQFGESIWEDQMQGGDNNTQYPEEVPKMPTGSRQAIVDSGDKEALKLYDEQLEEYNTYYNDYYKPMLDALANQSLNNAASNGIVLDKPKEEPVEEKVVEEKVDEEKVVEEKVDEDVDKKTSSTTLNDEADEIFAETDKPSGNESKDTSYTTLMEPKEVEVVERFTVENTGKGKANILRDGKPIVSNKNGITVTGLRADGNSVVVDAKIMGIKGTGSLGSFDIVNGKAVFTEGKDYEKLEGQDKIDFDTFKKAMELDIAYATKIQKQIQGEDDEEIFDVVPEDLNIT